MRAVEDASESRAERQPPKPVDNSQLARVKRTIAAIKPPRPVQRALDGLEAAQNRRREAQVPVDRLIAANQERPNSVSPHQIQPLIEALDAAKAEVNRHQGIVRDAIDAWAPELQAELAPHRADAAREIVAALTVVSRAMATIAECDNFVARWTVEPHPRLVLHDLNALRQSAEKIGGVG
jgi:hypothetical protein